MAMEISLVMELDEEVAVTLTMEVEVKMEVPEEMVDEMEIKVTEIVFSLGRSSPFAAPRFLFKLIMDKLCEATSS